MIGTKNKILQSAIFIWGQDFTASLEDIANHLGISRRTLHRHFSGREDLVHSVYNVLLEAYLLSVKQIIKSKSDGVETLKALFANDMENAERYLLFSHIQKLYFFNDAKEQEADEELRHIYISLFQQLINNNKIADGISIKWLELFYSSIIESVIKGIKSGLKKEDFMDMAWTSFWNGIKKVDY
jgi:AcrR family transcriptional regulator